MNSFTYWSPTKVIFGAGTAGTAGNEVKEFGGAMALVIYGGGSVEKNGVLGTVTRSLSDAGIKYCSAGGVIPNPTAEFAQKIVDDYRGKGIDFLLGVGGGSVIDTAKAVAHGLASPDTQIWDYFNGTVQVSKTLPAGAVLTIAAAGSETSNSAVLTNQGAGLKRGLTTQFNRPKFAIMDPTLTYSLPPRQTACGIVDIIMHTLERYMTSGTDNTLTDELAEALMRVVIKYGAVAMEKPDDYKARSELMWAGSVSHNGLTGLGQPMDFAVHQFGQQLSAKYDLPHGESLSATWSSWARYVYKEDIARFAKYARNVWGLGINDDETAAEEGIKTTERYFTSIGMPVTLTEAVGSLAADDIEYLVELCSYKYTRTIGAFKVLGVNDIREIYKSAM